MRPNAEPTAVSAVRGRADSMPQRTSNSAFEGGVTFCSSLISTRAVAYHAVAGLDFAYASLSSRTLAWNLSAIPPGVVLPPDTILIFHLQLVDECEIVLRRDVRSGAAPGPSGALAAPCESPMSLSISARGTSAATESIAISSSAGASGFR